MRNGLVKIFALLLLCAGIFVTGAEGSVAYPYQLRNVIGPSIFSPAGPQWFATVGDASLLPLLPSQGSIGGDMPGTLSNTWMMTSADLISGFSSVHLLNPTTPSFFSPPAVESIYLVKTELGSGQLVVDFGNEYTLPASEDVSLLMGPAFGIINPPSVSVPAKGTGSFSIFLPGGMSPIGSSLGHLDFRQTAQAGPLSGFLESIMIPTVVANVFDSRAENSNSALLFDMTVFDGAEPVTRKIFNWWEGQNEIHNLGDFFMIPDPPPTHRLAARVTNRTGARYYLQRYDQIAGTHLEPTHWEYDLTPYPSGLPGSFVLDAQSQIAPGLVTAYNNVMNMNMAQDFNVHEAFRLYPFSFSSNPGPQNLPLKYRVIKGMTPYGTVSDPAPITPAPSRWRVDAFRMDLTSPFDTTAGAIAGFTGGRPVMPAPTFPFTGVSNQFFMPGAFNSFMISNNVPGGLVRAGDTALLPMRVRMRISKNSFSAATWDSIANAPNVAARLPFICSIGLRLPSTPQLYADLFAELTAIGQNVEDCIQAFTHGDVLYVDFTVLLADAVRQAAGSTAFVQVVEHYETPYILIGDGNRDGRWELGFFVTDPGSMSPVTVPGTPTGVAAAAGNGQATISFVPPINNGGNSVTSYTVTSMPGGLKATGTSSPITVLGLTNGTEYTFTVVATNAVGDGFPSAPSNPVTPSTIPDAPTSVTAAAGNGQATISFTAPGYNGSLVTNYIVTSNPGGFTATGTSSPITVSGLTNGTSYTFTVVATNAIGLDSVPSGPSNAVTPFTVPDAPTDVAAIAGNGQATISFTPPGDNGSPITSYTVTSNPGGFTATGASSPITVSGLANGTSYIFTVIATNAAGNGPPSGASSSVTPRAVPSAPQSFTATPGNSRVELSWTAPASNGGSVITGYQVSRDGGAWVTASSNTGHTFTGLTNGTSYAFKVRAVNEAGPGAEALEQRATPFPPPPPIGSHQYPYEIGDVVVLDGHPVVGSQWFATLGYKNTPIPADWYRRNTYGGGALSPMGTSANLVPQFDSVYLNNYSYVYGNEALDSVCLIITGGNGKLDLLCNLPAASMDVLLSVPGYTTPAPDEWLDHPWYPTWPWPYGWQLYLSGPPTNYGSRHGYITFRQSNSLGYRESINIPLVVANVFDGLASAPGNELYFDMSVSDGSDIITRRKFRWGAGKNETHDLGQFFLIGAQNPAYNLTTRITNRTGVRYLCQRYDGGLGSAHLPIYPSHWEYDIPPDLYGSLPAQFQLDPQSQIAPGLVAAYTTRMNMTLGTTEESFRLYPFVRQTSALFDLRLKYRKVGGMTPYGAAVSSTDSSRPWTIRAFKMTFADEANNTNNTERQIAGYAGGYPVMPETGYAFTGAEHRYFKADAFNSFVVSADVPHIVDTGQVALLPMQVRMRISRKEGSIVGRWEEEIVKDENDGRLASNLSKYIKIWVHSPHTAEREMDLFTSLRNRGYSVEKCVQAFTNGDFLYVDFMVLLADAVSKEAGKTAFCYVVEDDKVPYILIGDGKVDDAWTIGFYVTGSTSLLDNPPSPNPNPNPKPGDGGGGGGCNIASLGMAIVLSGLILLTKRMKRK